MASRTPEHLAPATPPDAKGSWATNEEERGARDAVTEACSQLPGLLAKLARIPDPRRPKSVRLKVTMVLVYGHPAAPIAVHVPVRGHPEFASARAAGDLARGVHRRATWTSMPHKDTVDRPLQRIPRSRWRRPWLVRSAPCCDLASCSRSPCASTTSSLGTEGTSWLATLPGRPKP